MLVTCHQSAVLTGVGYDTTLGLWFFHTYYKHCLGLHLQQVADSTTSRDGNRASEI